MSDPSRGLEAQEYTANLDYTLKELQNKVRQHENELERLRARGDGISHNPAAQAQVVKTALKNVTESEPFLPPPSSILPALVALRRTHQTIVESKVFLVSQDAVIDSEKRQLETGQANLRDQKLLTEALNARIASLKEELDSNARTRPEDGAKRRRDELQKKKTGYDKDSKRLFKALNDFIDSHLAVMLAAEELGGPVVGDLMDVDNEDISAGFNAQGKLKKPKEGTNGDKTQRRIDDMLSGDRDAPRDEDEVAAAGREMKELIQALMEQLEDARGDNAASFVTLSRESAAARFLVRSKVAQFHPKDASKLRLIDFGRGLDA